MPLTSGRFISCPQDSVTVACGISFYNAIENKTIPKNGWEQNMDGIVFCIAAAELGC
jgi:hypothetical protein